jgi:hypothetical protein
MKCFYFGKCRSGSLRGGGRNLFCMPSQKKRAPTALSVFYPPEYSTRSCRGKNKEVSVAPTPTHTASTFLLLTAEKSAVLENGKDEHMGQDHRLVTLLPYRREPLHTELILKRGLTGKTEVSVGQFVNLSRYMLDIARAIDDFNVLVLVS